MIIVHAQVSQVSVKPRLISSKSHALITRIIITFTLRQDTTHEHHLNIVTVPNIFEENDNNQKCKVWAYFYAIQLHVVCCLLLLEIWFDCVICTVDSTIEESWAKNKPGARWMKMRRIGEYAN